ncbi:hypothetical protein JRO89_XS12G0225200 [Xanthoceras sorbifolium]|uniref:Glycosyltransferase n=1 Tax=Xanthoceras sorbifolium TaxID=99658 RepID=A0ABQ8HDE7_9ROSI|nr:hypothetical protein JRO89_XS12G0225200 [Xanthoceras sorbifolium]
MGKPHVLSITVPALGHVIPLMELSLYLIKHGIKITFVNAESAHNLVVNASATKGDIANSIGLVSIPDGDQPEILKEVIGKINASDRDKITCVLADPGISWAMEAAEEMGIRRAILCPFAATGLVLMSCIPKLIEDGIIGEDGTPTKKQTIQLSPTMPAMETSHFLWVSRTDSEFAKFWLYEYALRCKRSMSLANKMLSNSTYVLEPAAFKTNGEILPIGPLLAASHGTGNLAGNFWTEDSSCLKWLDQQATQSVIYVAFGSATTFDQTQFKEFAMALELCNRPFLWVVRPDFVEKLSDAYPEGFQERVGARGLIISWAPQQKVLEHPSIACFFTHCGWNSAMEALINGVPLLCWPFLSEQMHNHDYICNVWRVGLGFNRDEGGLIAREEIKNKLEELLGSEKYKANALDLKEKLWSSIKEGGSSYNNFMNFVEWLKE